MHHNDFTPPPPSMTLADAPKLPAPDPADSRIVDLLAYTLLFDTVAKEKWAAEKQDPDAAETARERWQSDIGLRGEWREKAKSIMFLLEASGLRIRSSDARRVAVQTEWIRTVPPRAAYAEDEIA